MFDIEQKMESIPDPKTRKLFEEVYSSYQHGNYRSAVVMLWSVVVADIIFKLKFLDDTYRNKKAASVLKDIRNTQEAKPESSEWEKELLKKAYEELKFITLDDKINLEYLHTQRNLSAHPVLTDANLLLTPNKDITRSLIRSAMEAILLKTPLLHSELVNSIVEDLASNKDRLGSYENIKPYIQKRYFPNISDNGAIKIFKALWRFIFDTRNPEEQDNQLVNFYALVAFSERYRDLYINEIKNNSSYYQVSSSQIDLLIGFLSDYPQMYNVLDESVKTLISSSVQHPLGQFMICDFLSSNLEEHFETVLSRLDSEVLSISEEDLKRCFEKAKDKEIVYKFLYICIKIYSKSIDYNDADAKYYQYISPFLSNYSLNDILVLMRETNNKSQVCNRNRAWFDHKNILERFYKVGGTVNLLNGLNMWKYWNTLMLEEQAGPPNGFTEE